MECVAVTEEGEEGLDGVGDWMDGGGASYEGATNNEVSDSDSVMQTRDLFISEMAQLSNNISMYVQGDKSNRGVGDTYFVDLKTRFAPYCQTGGDFMY